MDITYRAYLLSYVRYVYNNDFVNHYYFVILLFCQPLLGCTTRMDIFQKDDDFFTELGLF